LHRNSPQGCLCLCSCCTTSGCCCCCWDDSTKDICKVLIQANNALHIAVQLPNQQDIPL
jgi:hypothetical protein